MSIFTGTSTTTYRSNIKPILGLQYISTVNKHVVLGIELVYEPYKFTMPMINNTIETDRIYSSKIIYVAPLLGLILGKRKSMQVCFVPALGITSNVEEYQHDFGFVAYPNIYYGDTVKIDSYQKLPGVGKRFVFKVGLELQKSFPVYKVFNLFVGGGVYNAVTSFSENSVSPYLGGKYAEPKPIIFSFRAGLAYQFMKKTKLKE